MNTFFSRATHSICLRAGGALLLIALLWSIPDARAQMQTDLGVHVGYNAQISRPLIGVNALLSTPALPVQINPDFDFYFVQGVTAMQLNANALYPFAIDHPTIMPYAGAGLGLYYVSVGEFSATELGLNLIGGAEFAVGNLKPFAQGRFTVGAGNAFSLTGGVRFSL